MDRIRPFVIVPLVLLSLLVARASWGEETFVTSEGVAEIRQGAVNIARDAAVEDAQKKAVEQAIGICIGSLTQVENYRLISDKILSQVKRYIIRYNLVDERNEENLLRVKINAEVSLGKLSNDLSAIGIRKGAGGARSVTIIITGLTKAQFAKFKDVLLNQGRGIKNLRERSFSGATATVQVDSERSVQRLSDELALKDFGTFSVEVTASTANSLELKVVPK